MWISVTPSNSCWSAHTFHDYKLHFSCTVFPTVFLSFSLSICSCPAPVQAQKGRLMQSFLLFFTTQLLNSCPCSSFLWVSKPNLSGLGCDFRNVHGRNSLSPTPHRGHEIRAVSKSFVCKARISHSVSIAEWQTQKNLKSAMLLR